MKTCENCKYSEPMVGALACMGQKGMPYVRPTDSCDRWKTMKQTNADRIRAMSDEELAVICEDGCPPNHECPPMDREEIGKKSACQQCWLDWLKQEVSET